MPLESIFASFNFVKFLLLAIRTLSIVALEISYWDAEKACHGIMRQKSTGTGNVRLQNSWKEMRGKPRRHNYPSRIIITAVYHRDVNNARIKTCIARYDSSWLLHTSDVTQCWRTQQMTLVKQRNRLQFWRGRRCRKFIRRAHRPSWRPQEVCDVWLAHRDVVKAFCEAEAEKTKPRHGEAAGYRGKANTKTGNFLPRSCLEPKQLPRGLHPCFIDSRRTNWAHPMWTPAFLCDVFWWNSNTRQSRLNVHGALAREADGTPVRDLKGGRRSPLYQRIRQCTVSFPIRGGATVLKVGYNFESEASEIIFGPPPFAYLGTWNSFHYCNYDV